MFSDNSVDVPVLTVNSHWIHHGRSLDDLSTSPSYINVTISSFSLLFFLLSFLSFLPQVIIMHYYSLGFCTHIILCVFPAFLCSISMQSKIGLI